MLGCSRVSERARVVVGAGRVSRRRAHDRLVATRAGTRAGPNGETGEKLLASTRGTSGGIMLFWSEGGERVTEGQKNIVVVAVYRPCDDRQLQQNCSSDPSIARSLPRALASRLLSLLFAFMSVIVWTGDHSKTIAERLRLANNLGVDVLIDSNIYNALDLGRYPKNSAHPKYVVVPAQILFLAVGGAFHLYGDVRNRGPSRPPCWFMDSRRVLALVAIQPRDQHERRFSDGGRH